MITIEELCSDNRKLVDENLKLRKENAELKKKLKEKLKTIADKDLSFVAKFDALEIENAELKEQNIKDCENFNKTMSETKERWNKEHYQLAKAKEIIKRLLLAEEGNHFCDVHADREHIKARKEAVEFLGREG